MTRETAGFGIEALDGLFGTGLQRGSVTNLTGPPGIGKTRISLSFIAEGMRKGEAGLLVCFSTVPLVNVIRGIRDIERFRPLFQTDEPVIMDLNDLDRVDILTGLIEDGGIDRLVLDHPEAMALRGSGKWFTTLEELLSTARSFEITTMIVDYDQGAPVGIGRYVCDGIVSLKRDNGRMGATVSKWDLDPDLVGREVWEEVPGAWRS